MKLLTNEQEATMVNWARTVALRPGKRAKAFLQADRGLTEEQIDAWWDHALSYQKQQQLQECALISAQIVSDSLPQSTSNSYGHPVSQVSHASSRDTVSTITAHRISAGLPEPPVEIPTEDVVSALPTFARRSSYSSAHSSSHKSTLSSQTPSLARSNSILSVPSQDWEIIDHSNRSSNVYNGLLPAVDTASSLFSFHELFSDTSFGPDLTSETELLINPVDLSAAHEDLVFGVPSNGSLMGEHHSMSSFAQVPSIADPNNSWPTNQTQNVKNYRVSLGTSPRPESTPKAERTTVKFACTVCQRSFASKGDWKRHEGSQCEPQKSWICMLGDNPAIWTEAGLACTFCDAIHPGPDSDEMLAHLEKEHKINQCIRKAPEDRSFRRKDKLKTHLQRIHSLSEYSTHWEKWHQCATTQDKSAWGCGFCGVCLFTWDGRLEHIAEHFEKRLDISQWSHSLMIKGLLKQPTADFNVLGAWRTYVDTDDDRYFEWSKDDAAELKLKLEFRKGTPQELATEAFRLAQKVDQSDRMSIIEGPMWKDPNRMES